MEPLVDSPLVLNRLLSQGKIALEPAAFLARPPAALPEDWDFERVEGMLLGLAIGDALGNTSEAQLPAQRRASYGEIRDYLPNQHAGNRPVGLPSDDSQMAFWTLEQLLADRGLVPDHLAAKFTRHRIYGIGETVRGFLRAYKDQGQPWDEAGQPSAGNGALMRIAPVILPHLRRPSPGLWADAALAGMITHNDRASHACCLAFVSILWECLRLKAAPDPMWWVDQFLAVAGQVEGETAYASRNPKIHHQGPLWQFVDREVRQAYREGLSIWEACNRWYSGAYLIETMPSVLYILARLGDSPEEAIVRAVNDTKDNDTVAAIVGAAVGALHGRAGLPPRWIHGLVGRTGAQDDWHVFELIEAARQTFWQAGPGVSEDNIRAVTAFLPVFEQPGFEPGKWVVQAGAFPYFEYSSEVLQFLKALGQNNFIQPFNWTAWEEGKRLAEEPALLAQASLATIRKLLTLYVRADRFTEGYLAEVFESGQMVRILERVRDFLPGSGHLPTQP